MRHVMLSTGCRANLVDEGLELGVDGQVLAVRVIEHLFVDRSVIDERCGHVPVGRDHAKGGAVLAKDSGLDLLYAAGMKLSDKPVAGFAHYLFAPQFVETQDQIGILMLGAHKSFLRFKSAEPILSCALSRQPGVWG